MPKKKAAHFVSPAVVFDHKKIEERVTSLAARISRDYAGKEITVVSILKGSVVFCADLLRRITVPCTLDFISVSSYRGARSTGVVRLLTDLRENPVGKHLLIVEDIIDKGYTLKYLKENLLTRHPASVRVCVLLDKPAGRRVAVDVDYVGFAAPDRFLVGYGLDFQEQYRNLPYIGALKGMK